MSGEPNISFNVQAKESEHQIEVLFAFLEKQEKQVIFAIDEKKAFDILLHINRVPKYFEVFFDSSYRNV